MNWDKYTTTMAWATNTSSEYVKRAAEDLIKNLNYRKRVTLDSPLPPVTWDSYDFRIDDKLKYSIDDKSKEEIMDYTACYKEKKEMLFPEMDWYEPSRMTNYYFRIPVEMRIDGRKLRNDPTQFRPDIKKIIFNDPATIILWNDGTKTVVKCGPDDAYDPEKGYVMCLLKRFCGNDTAMFHKFLKYGMKNYIPEEKNCSASTDEWPSPKRLRNAGLTDEEISMIYDMRVMKEAKDDGKSV